MNPLSQLKRLSFRAERRLRYDRALSAGIATLTAALAIGVITLALRKTGLCPEWVARVIFASAALWVVLGVLVAYNRRLPTYAGAIVLDRAFQLSGRLSNALAFGSLPHRTPLMDLAITDAMNVATGADPKKAVPLRSPRDLGVAAGLLATLLAMTLFEVRKHEPIASARVIQAVEVTPDDLDAMREFLHEMQARLETDEAKVAAQAFNQLIEDLAAQRLDRTEAFRRMQALEDRLLEGRQADRKVLEDALQKIGDELKKADLTKPAGDALEAKNLAASEARLRELAKKLREKGGALDKAQLEKMRESLKTAAQDQAKRQQAILQRRDELEKQLLLQKQKPNTEQSDEDRNLLKKRERELERLDREREQQQAVGRQLDRLDRELEKAAEDLMHDLGLSASDLDQGAEDINRMAREEMSQEEKEQLRQKLEELRETLRQQGQGGAQQLVRLRRFQNRARGKGGKPGEPGSGGEEGKDDESPAGTGQQGEGETWTVSPNGEKMLMLSRGAQGQGGEGEKGPSNPHGWGTGHDEGAQGTATHANMGTQDTQVAGQENGQGASRSEVIEGAAERGFASRGYQKVYVEYHTVAEEALNKDEIPPGYRFYVRRYFQLIRPREAEK